MVELRLDSAQYSETMRGSAHGEVPNRVARERPTALPRMVTVRREWKLLNFDRKRDALPHGFQRPLREEALDAETAHPPL